MTTRLEILGDDGRWHEVPGVVSVELRHEQPDDPRDEVYRRHDAFDSLVFSMPRLAGRIELSNWIARFREACDRAEEETRRVTAASVVDQDGRPIRRRDRPAWQSPYGPARRSR
ncbi:hypothetical protein [Streptomyces tagetis]|uniref:Uncharacterized protein n=1 Tax=Streptomyces tagetis TaxID=2820809 RepID=A0A940XHU0_9ACTN|nr:hypothetical protein [Streptomyces sp. RG38]MBQ0827677.1 hypothetical protein [Streptomyces sp. RG38]